MQHAASAGLRSDGWQQQQQQQQWGRRLPSGSCCVGLGYVCWRRFAAAVLRLLLRVELVFWLLGLL
jgi:hypothetical protein